MELQSSDRELAILARYDITKYEGIRQAYYIDCIRLAAILVDKGSESPNLPRIR